MSESQKSLNSQLYDAISNLGVANDRLFRMRQLLIKAQQDEEEARFAVNDAQKHFDGLIKSVKNTALYNTAWWPKIN